MTGRAFAAWRDARLLPERPALTDHDATERLGPDDMATMHTEQLFNAAMLDHQRAAAKAPASTAGVCSNCDEACLPGAVYCDDDCRSDHEQRVQTQRRQGAPR